MSDDAEAKTSQTKGHVKTFPDLQALVNTFFDVLPGQAVGQVQRNKDSLSIEDIETFKNRIKLGQELFEEFEAARLATNTHFTAEELEKMDRSKLQKIAKGFRVKATMSNKNLIATLTGRPKSIPAIKTKYWKNKDGRSILISRLREAREAYKAATGEDFSHPRQIAAAERATNNGR